MIRFEALDGATVSICAPVHASLQITDLERRLGLAGASVLAPVPPNGALSPIERARITSLHLRKIETADVVVVANVGGYTGAGTAGEIAHALRCGKPVMFLEEPIELETTPETYAALVARTGFTEVRPAGAFPAQLARGSIVSLFAPEDQAGNTAWLRVVEVLRFPGRIQMAVALDATRVCPGMDAEALLAHLDHVYPGDDDGEFTAVEFEFVAELHDPPHPVRTQPVATVALFARNTEGAVAATELPDGRLALPTREIEAGQYPLDAAERFAREHVGARAEQAHLIAIDVGAAGTAGVMRGMFVVDLGQVPAEHAAESGSACEGRVLFTVPQDLLQRADPRTARITQALLHRRAEAGVLLLEDGHLPGQRTVWDWYEAGDLPGGLPVTQAGVWAVDRDGRFVLQHRIGQGGRFALPAGSPESDDRDPLATAAREAFEESQIVIDQRRARLIGYQVTYSNPTYPNGLAQARFVAPILGYYPIATDSDPALGGARPPYRRYLVDVRRAAALLGWGPHADAQTRAAEQAARELGFPVDRPAADGYRDHGDPRLGQSAPAWELAL